MPERIHEILPGVLHWTAPHPSAGIESASHLLVADGVLLDPIAPPEGISWFDDRSVRLIVLTNRHHTRSAFEIQDRLGIPVRAPRTGMHDLPADRVEPYDFGDSPVAGVTAYAISETWPDETALHIPSVDAVAIADGFHNYDGLGFFPDHLLGDDPEAEKQRLRDGFLALCDEIEFENVLFAHGSPIIGGGRAALREFASA